MRFDYAEPCKTGNALTGFGYLLRLAAAMAVTLILGADIEPLISWILL